MITHHSFMLWEEVDIDFITLLKKISEGILMKQARILD